MNSKVTIKSIPNGIKVILDENCDFSDLIEEIGLKFRESAKFFRGGRLCVSFIGRELSDLEENTLVETMETNGEFHILYIISRVNDEDGNFQKALSNTTETTEDTKGFGSIYEGKVSKDEHLSFPNGVLICGDVEPGAVIKAKGNVIILGGLFGSVNIESKEGSKPFVFALEMSPERIKIDNIRYYSPDKPKWSIRPKYQAKIAFVEDKKIILKDTNESSFKELFKE